MLYVKLIEGKRVRDFLLSPLGNKDKHLRLDVVKNTGTPVFEPKKEVKKYQSIETIFFKNSSDPC